MFLPYCQPQSFLWAANCCSDWSWTVAAPAPSDSNEVEHTELNHVGGDLPAMNWTLLQLLYEVGLQLSLKRPPAIIGNETSSQAFAILWNLEFYLESKQKQWNPTLYQYGGSSFTSLQSILRTCQSFVMSDSSEENTSMKLCPLNIFKHEFHSPDSLQFRSFRFTGSSPDGRPVPGIGASANPQSHKMSQNVTSCRRSLAHFFRGKQRLEVLK